MVPVGLPFTPTYVCEDVTGDCPGLTHRYVRTRGYGLARSRILEMRASSYGVDSSISGNSQPFVNDDPSYTVFLNFEFANTRIGNHTGNPDDGSCRYLFGAVDLNVVFSDACDTRPRPDFDLHRLEPPHDVSAEARVEIGNNSRFRFYENDSDIVANYGSIESQQRVFYEIRQFRDELNSFVSASGNNKRE